MTTWWREGFRVTMRISRITQSLRAKNKRLWDVEDAPFKLLDSDVRHNSDEIEEQLWGILCE